MAPVEWATGGRPGHGVQSRAMATEKPVSKSVPGLNRGGRPKGSVNRTTKEFREIVNDLLHANEDNFAKWVAQVAEGIPPTLDANGKVLVPGRPGNPGEAARLIAMFAEYAAPKLTRAEVTGEGGGALNVIIHKLGG